MKKMRKGFTLLELLVVIGVMGILGATGMIAGQEATNAARATNIADGLEKAAAAMMMYYSDVASTVAISGTDSETVKKGANAYLKSTSALVVTGDGDEAETGKYSVVVTAEDDPTAEWWVIYTLAEAEKNTIGAILENKATNMNLASDTNGTAYVKGQTSVAMKVR